MKDTYDEFIYHKHSREPKWWDRFEHSTTALSTGITNIFIGTIGFNIYNVVLGILYLLDFIWDLYQDYRNRSL